MKTSLLLCLSILFTNSFAQVRDKRQQNELNDRLVLTVETTNTGAAPRVKGIVQDHVTGEAIPYCKVIFTDENNKIEGRMTDANGQFEFDSIHPGEYHMQIDAIGYSAINHLITFNNGLAYKLIAEIYYPQIMTEKPIIYLYPEQTASISVSLTYQGQLTHTYPTYPATGWNVSAQPNGTLVDQQGKEYYALFWEGEPYKPLTAPDGFVVAGKDVASFLEEKLAYLGLNRREANEFIMYWLPRLENNPFNLIHFSSAEYESLAKLNITPTPETLIRVMMVFQPLNEPVDFPLQDLTPLHKTRSGFTVVEWGGCELKESNL